ncbi:MAG: hypothetical protein P4L44_05760 [Oryzomonas sp.]|uniref:hypothetical protein n=1 Tax=Oryzomonas sp. TaxID=2855186 RepID=UPI00284BD295|nr:hypothetical protein [Oryzomonas sp.]MDR3579445.1 hypothetical protein [Oryzomonas sp.]
MSPRDISIGVRLIAGVGVVLTTMVIIELSVDNVRSAGAGVKQSCGTIGSIRARTGEMIRLIVTVSSDTSSQLAAASDISTSISQISVVILNASTSSEEMVCSAKNLADGADNLKTLTANFSL